ncbi:MAG: hypothetical protein BM485_08470 [Desulfobulbaceae bacterium DB1]|nr:MAG: hypothetical protein BM485_08470 [Desulfobulbaceae bacterium DB1]
MSQERLFRQKHPLITGFFILGMISVFFWFGITFFVSSMNRHVDTSDLFSSNSVEIGVVQLKGVIADAETAINQLSRFSRSKSIKAIVVRIDSPGGAVGASQEIFHEISKVNAVKPVVASMGSVAASGGFYAALGAGKILASPGTLTGSMGVILKFPNLEQIFQKIGYKDEVIKSGEMKDIGSPSRPLSVAERQLLQNLIDEVHQQFIKDIAASRKLDMEKVRRVADGRIFSGETAKQLGLIDDFGNFNDAVTLAAKLAGYEDAVPSLIYPEEDRLSLMKLLAENKFGAFFRQATASHPLLSFEWSYGH